jgi:hypothetical protein
MRTMRATFESDARGEICHIVSFGDGAGGSCVRYLHAHGQRLLVYYRV